MQSKPESEREYWQDTIYLLAWLSIVWNVIEGLAAVTYELLGFGLSSGRVDLHRVWVPMTRITKHCFSNKTKNRYTSD